MKYYIDALGVVHAFDDAAAPAFFADMTEISEAVALDMVAVEVVAMAPTVCTPAQGLVALFALKQITEDHVLDAIAQIPDPVQQYTAKIGYQRATVWERGSPTMQAMAELLQLSEEDLDELFTYAVGVQV